MDKKYTFTIDCETDQGGRLESCDSIVYGMKDFLKKLKTHNVKALFFISTELLDDFGESDDPRNKPRMVQFAKQILDEGHAIGSHGHFHIRYPTRQRLLEDKRISELVLDMVLGIKNPPYRAPKFDRRTWEWSEPYSNPKNHVSLLKHVNLGQKIPKDPILYLHMSDLYPRGVPPNLFCKLWYSNAKKACKVFDNLLSLYGGQSK